MPVKEVMVTPEMASEMLQRNTANFRNPGRARVTTYANDMKNGQWRFNGDTLKFSGELLLDGQHRLMAIVESGVSVKMLIVDGIESDAGVTVDNGKPRTVGQWLAHKGVKNASSIAAMAKLCVTYNLGAWQNQSIGVDRYSRTDIVKYAEAHSSNLQVAFGLAKSCGSLVPSSVVGALAHIAAGQSIDPSSNELIVWFCDRLAHGAELQDNEPVFQLRKRLMASHTVHKLSPTLRRILTTIAWNKTAKGESCTTIIIQGHGTY